MYSKTGEIAWRNHIHRSDTLLALFRRVLLKGTGRSPFAVGGLSAVADEPVAQQRSGEDWLQFDTGTIGYTSTDTGPTAEPNARTASWVTVGASTAPDACRRTFRTWGRLLRAGTFQLEPADRALVETASRALEGVTYLDSS